MANNTVNERDKKKIRTVSLSDKEIKSLKMIPESEGQVSKAIRFLISFYEKIKK